MSWLRRIWRALVTDSPNEPILLAGLVLVGLGLAGLDWHYAAVGDGLVLVLVGLGFSFGRAGK
jgi:hypothetical protein